MWRYFTYTGKKRYVDTLDDLVLSYNNSKPRTIRMSPSDVTTNDELDLLRDMHNIHVPREAKQSFRVGDSVRMAMTKKTFKKWYTDQWSEKLFVVSEKLCTIPTTYRVTDLVDEQIDGTFYYQELQLVRVVQDKIYTVERILKKINCAKKIEYFVKWKGYGNKFNTWIIKEVVIAWYSHLASRHHGSILYQTAKQQNHERLTRKQNIFIRYKTSRRNSPYGTMGDWTEENTVSTLVVQHRRMGR